MHAAKVTIVSAVPAISCLLFASATAIKVCEPANLTRVETRAIPEFGERLKSTIPGIGLRSENRDTLLIKLSWFIGLSTSIVTGTELPFSLIVGMAISTRELSISGIFPNWSKIAFFIELDNSNAVAGIRPQNIVPQLPARTVLRESEGKLWGMV